jgi:phage shock protein A
MSVLNRFSDILNSNVNSMLDQAEDPKKMVSFITREMEQTLITIRTESSRYLAEKKNLANRINQLNIESEQWQERAELAIEKGRDDLAKAALKEKNLHHDAVTQCEVEMAHIDEVVFKLSSDANELTEKLKFTRARQKALVLRGNSVKSRMKVKRQLHDVSCEEALDRFEAYERKLDDMEGEVEAWDLGSKTHSGSSNASLEAELNSLAHDDKVDDELEKLKQRMRT